MTAPECTFILPNGKKCRCAATRNQILCRHHAPKPAVPEPPPIPKCELYSNLRRWRQLGAELQSMPASEIPATIYELLDCLIDRGPNSTGSISDLTVGRFLRVLLNRQGDVPFPDPERAGAEVAAPVPVLGAHPQTAAAAGSQPSSAPEAKTGKSRIAEINALLASYGLPPYQGPWLPPRTPVNQGRA